MARQQNKDVHEKHQAILSRLLKDDDNKYCVDCDAKGESKPATYLLHNTYMYRGVIVNGGEVIVVVVMTSYSDMTCYVCLGITYAYALGICQVFEYVQIYQLKLKPGLTCEKIVLISFLTLILSTIINLH